MCGFPDSEVIILVWCVRALLEDCLFHRTPWCTECRECAYCGKHLSWTPDRSNIHFDVIVVNAPGERKVVPICGDCSLSKGRKGLKEWLRWMHDNRPDKWQKIVDYNERRKHKIAQVVHEIRASIEPM